MENKEEIIKKILNKRNIDKLENFTTIVNDDKPFFEKEDYKIVEGIPKYFEPDEYGRTTGGIAIISKYTLSIMVEKHLKYPDPNRWTSKIDKSGVFQRCHCIAYRLSAKKNDKNNIFIGTLDLNKKIMNEIENGIEKYIRENEKEYIKILYRVTPQYKGKNQIPTGVLIEAENLDTKFSICRFCYNVEKNVTFNYDDGSIIRENNKIKKIVTKLKRSYSRKKQIESKNENFSVNSQTKIYHLENCTMLSKVEPKYIKEITTKEKVLIKEGYSSCKVCKTSK